ncbi:sensor domain-containing diguanylate cyclase [Vibrio clamense]|uniref:transporter substrate-binding domain-containing diguanylate cyclase n=1 Tax=Vibrio clamense TaxID=2910254 RepID=UPI003D249622
MNNTTCRFIFWAISGIFFSFSSAIYAHEPSQSDLPPLTVSNSKAWKPFSYLDSNGEPKGILIDFWKAYSNKTGRRVEFVLTDWSRSIELVKNGEVDIHGGLAWSEPRDKFLDYGDEFLTVNSQIFLKQSLLKQGVDAFLENGGGRGVGVVRDGFYGYYVSQQFPQLKLVEFATNRDLMYAAFDEEVDAFITDLQVASFYTHTASMPSKYAPVMHIHSVQLRPAVAEGNLELLESINNSYGLLGIETKEQILNHWMHIETVYPPYLFPGIAVFIIVMSSVYIVQLRKTVRARTAELESANENLLRMTYTDSLTGISNRRYFMQQLEQIENMGQSAVVMVFDIDNFKVINDSYGHMCGDEVIKEVARRSGSGLPEGTLFARIGGEEFALYLRGIACSDAEIVADALCRNVFHMPIEVENENLNISISVGCAFYSCAPKVINIDAADKLMYQAKQEGKNRYVLEIRN